MARWQIDVINSKDSMDQDIFSDVEPLLKVASRSEQKLIFTCSEKDPYKEVTTSNSWDVNFVVSGDTQLYESVDLQPLKVFINVAQEHQDTHDVVLVDIVGDGNDDVLKSVD